MKSTYRYVQQAQKAGHQTFYYYYNASFPNIQPHPNSGAYHASEIEIMFGTHNTTGASFSKGIPSTTQEIALSNFMVNAWANFARNPMRGPGWPAVGSTKEDVGVLGANGTSGVTVVEQSVIAGRCHLFM
jgi:carboxylesterase type B